MSVFDNNVFIDAYTIVVHIGPTPPGILGYVSYPKTFDIDTRLNTLYYNESGQKVYSNNNLLEAIVYPSNYIVFDTNVFDWSFADMNIIPTFNKVIMEREFQKVEVGQAIAILCNIQDIMTTPGQRFQFNPSLTPQVQLYNPDNTIKFGWSNMTFVSTGVYTYQHQTLSTDNLGFYTAQFRATDGTMTGITDNMVIFEVIQ